MAPQNGDVTRLLQQWSDGDPDALDRLLPQIIDHVKQQARKALSLEAPGYTLEPTELLNEVYIRLVGRKTYWWRDRVQFFSTLAELMRRILVDRARRRLAAKRGAGAERLSFDEGLFAAKQPAPVAIRLNDCLQELEKIDERKYRIVVLTIFVGMTQQQIAKTLSISVNTVGRHWQAARLWLRHAMSQDDTASEDDGTAHASGPGAPQ